jgi:hypothetical protein
MESGVRRYGRGGVGTRVVGRWGDGTDTSETWCSGQETALAWLGTARSIQRRWGRWHGVHWFEPKYHVSKARTKSKWFLLGGIEWHTEGFV